MRAKGLTVALVAAAAGAVAYMSFAEGSEPEAGQASPQASKGAIPFSDGDAGCTPSAHHHCPRLEPTLR